MNIKASMNYPDDLRNKIMVLLVVGFLSFLISFGVWIWRLTDLSQKENKKSFKNSLWLTFLMPWGFAIPILYMSTIGMMASFLNDASWWVYPTILFTAMDIAFLGAALVGKYLPGQEEEEKEIVISKKIESTFQCGVCYNKYNQDLFGAETIREGKICRPCLARKQLEAK